MRGDLAHICNPTIREGWLQTNPVAGAVRPKAVSEGGEVLRFLDVESVYQQQTRGFQFVSKSANRRYRALDCSPEVSYYQRLPEAEAGIRTVDPLLSRRGGWLGDVRR